MLLEAAAILLTSAALAPVAGAFTMSESCLVAVRQRSVEPVVQQYSDEYARGGDVLLGDDWFAVPPGASATSAEIPTSTFSLASSGGTSLHTLAAGGSHTLAPLPADELAALTGSPLLRQLAVQPIDSVSGFVEAHPQVIASLIAAPPPARDVSHWWQSLDAGRQWNMLHVAPRLVGNLDGVPAEVRDRANRLWIEQYAGEIEASLASSGRSVADDAARRIHMLDRIETALGTPQSVPSRSLLSLDPEGQGRAAIVLGNLGTADYVTYLIPGMFFNVDGQIGDWTDTAARLYDDQVSWLRLVRQPDDPVRTAAVVAWMGYQTPNLITAGGFDLANEGRDSIARTIMGLQEERAGDEPHITIVGHSYGSTAALMALTEYDFEIDALALVGSPGSAAKSVDELNVRDGNVFAAEADWDWIPNSSFFGSDPGAESYGAKKMSVGGGVDVITNELLAASIGHNEYFGPGTESMRNMALIGIGCGELVTDGSEYDRNKTLAILRW